MGANHTTLRGLAIRNARGNGVLALNVRGVRVEDCEVGGHGQHGVVITGFESGIDGSTVHSVGCSGIRVAGGVARTLTPGHSFATGNTVSDFALVKRTYQPGERRTLPPRHVHDHWHGGLNATFGQDDDRAVLHLLT